MLLPLWWSNVSFVWNQCQYCLTLSWTGSNEPRMVIYRFSICTDAKRTIKLQKRFEWPHLFSSKKWTKSKIFHFTFGKHLVFDLKRKKKWKLCSVVHIKMREFNVRNKLYMLAWFLLSFYLLHHSHQRRWWRCSTVPFFLLIIVLVCVCLFTVNFLHMHTHIAEKFNQYVNGLQWYRIEIFTRAISEIH